MNGILPLIGDINFDPPVKVLPNFTTISIFFLLKLISSLCRDDSRWCKYPAAHQNLAVINVYKMLIFQLLHTFCIYELALSNLL